MESRRIGSLTVSVLGLGGNNFGRKLSPEDTKRVVDAALDAGITFFDTADRYGYGDHPYSGVGTSEQYLGAALASRRQDVVLATKFGNQMVDDDPSTAGGGRAWVRQACEDSLRRLGTDHIDLYQMHRPDPATPIEETIGALDELVEEGKIREYGFVNYSPEQIRAAAAAARQIGGGRFVSMQMEYSLLYRVAEAEVLPALEETDVKFLPFFPLASGLLTGKYRRGAPAPEDARLAFWAPRPHQVLSDENFDLIEDLTRFAEARGHTLLELAFAWLVAKPVVASVHAGATSPAQVRSNAEAVSWKLTPQDLGDLDVLLAGRDV